MSERPTYPKSTCCIPGCPRWSRKFPGEWVCARHWKMVPRRCRRAVNKVTRRLHSMWDANPSDGNWSREASLAYSRVFRLYERLWAHGRRAVLLREAGL